MDKPQSTLGIEVMLQAIVNAIVGKQSIVSDAGNGWKKIDHGTFVEYYREDHYNTPWTAAAGQTNIANFALPTGVTDFRNLNPQVTISTPNAAVMLGGYIGGATPDFNTISIYTYNPTGGGIVCAYWHAFVRLTKIL